MTDPDQQRRSLGGDAAILASGSDGSDSCLMARTALTVCQAQERQLSIQKKKGMPVDRAQAKALVFRLARQELDGWVSWPGRLGPFMAAQVAEEEEQASGTPVTINAGIMQRVLERHVGEQLEGLTFRPARAIPLAHSAAH